MNDGPRQCILSLIATYGPDVLNMSRTVEGELHLTCPQASAEVNGLIAALRHGVVHYLLVLEEAGKLDTIDVPAQVQRLRTEAGLEEAEAQRAVNTWADIIATGLKTQTGERTWRQEPGELHRARFSGLRDALIVGLAGLSGSLLPWMMVLEEKRGHHWFISAQMDALGAHALLNLFGALGGFLGGALGWMFGSPLSLEFQVSGGLASAHRVIVASLAAGLGSYFGLWLGYHHVADIGAFFGPLLGAGIAAFLATIFTFTRRRMGAWNK
jgi:hypothetical protein